MEFDFQILRGLYCRLLSIGFLAYIKGLIEPRETVSIVIGLKIKCGLGAFVGFLSSRK